MSNKAFKITVFNSTHSVEVVSETPFYDAYADFAPEDYWLTTGMHFGQYSTHVVLIDDSFNELPDGSTVQFYAFGPNTGEGFASMNN